MKTGHWIAIAIASLLIYVAAGPFITIHQIKSGVQTSDTEKLSDNVDFAALRENIKEQLNAKVTHSAATEFKNNPFEALALAFSTKLIDGAVDAFVTPSGLAKLMEGKKPSLSLTSSDEQTDNKEAQPFKNVTKYSIDSINKFSAWVESADGKNLRFVFTRDGLDWKLTNVVLPKDL